MSSTQPFTTSRRAFLRTSALSSALVGAPSSALLAAETRQAADNRGTARNVVFMVSDGMNHGALSLAQQYRALVHQSCTEWMKLYRERPVVRSLIETFSANSMVTDSAAAASAWGAGQRVNNNAINVDPTGRELPTMFHKVRETGRATGLVSTATITHATPAGFAANVSSRGDETTIAQQYLDRQVDVLLGGGLKFFSESLRAKYRSQGYDLVLSRAELQALQTQSKSPLLGLFAESHLPFSIDRNHVESIAAQVPTLAELTQIALDRLHARSTGFFLMVEGARVDHAGHANDAAASIQDQLDFDEALGTVLKYCDTHGDTLLVVTTDHGCGGIQMNGVSVDGGDGLLPGSYNASTAAFLKLQGFRRSLEWLKQNGVEGLSGSRLRDELERYTGIRVTSSQLKQAQGLNLSVAEVFQAYTGVGWTSGNHTGELVECCSVGPGSQRFPSFVRNYEVHDLVLQALDIDPQHAAAAT